MVLACRLPQSVNLTATEGAFIFLVPVALILAPGALKSGDFSGFITNFAFYAVFSAIISTALAKIMFAASGMMPAGYADKMEVVIRNIPILILMLVLTIPIAMLGIRIAEKVLQKQAAKLT